MNGVPLPDLHCPTCGVKYEDYTIYSDASDTWYEVPLSPPYIVEKPEPWFIFCPNGHKWSVKTIWRTTKGPVGPDRVQLDQYLGQS